MKNLTTIMYHYVRNIKESKYPDIKGLEVSDFNEQLDYLQKHYNFVTIEQVISSFETGDALPSNAVLLTFDDGYAEHFKYVYPILKKRKIQGCFYPPAKVITENTVLDVNKIHFILASARDPDLLVEDIKYLLKRSRTEYNLRSFEYYYSKLAIANRFDTAQVVFIKRLLQHELDEVLRNKITDELFVKYVGIEEGIFSQELYMNTDQISHLIKEGMHIGNHGYEHYFWDKLPPNKLANEIDLSLKFMKKVGVDLNNWTACYPYGSSSPAVVSFLYEKGCKLAFTTEQGVSNLESSDKMLMQRLDTNDIPKKADAPTNEWYDKP